MNVDFYTIFDGGYLSVACFTLAKSRVSELRFGNFTHCAKTTDSFGYMRQYDGWLDKSMAEKYLARVSEKMII